LLLKLIKTSTLKVYPALSHVMLTENADLINPDQIAFIRG
jgi:non-heme chloroperoxidase